VGGHVSTRHGGVSPAPWNSLNFSTSRGDDVARVRENRRRFAEALGVASQSVISCRQVHGTTVAKVDWDDAGRLIDGTDALITDEVRLPLSLVFADCVPVLLYDPVHHALGICHAGWRGTLNGAATATLWAMIAAYGTNPLDLLACLGPSIGPESYEVGEEVVQMAKAKLSEPERCLNWPAGKERAHFDLWQANRLLLEEAGVPAVQIEVAGIDTASNIYDFYSHRAEQGKCGLFGMMAWLDEKIENTSITHQTSA
jgi:polyphenol oxidase